MQLATRCFSLCPLVMGSLGCTSPCVTPLLRNVIGSVQQIQCFLKGKFTPYTEAYSQPGSTMDITVHCANTLVDYYTHNAQLDKHVITRRFYDVPEHRDRQLLPLEQRGES